MKNKSMLRIVSVVMAIVLTLCPLSICFATDPTPTPTSPAIQQVDNLAKEVIMYYVWVYLRSVGINVEYGDIETFTGAVNDWIEQELLEWLDTVPGIGTIDQLLFPWKFFWNPNGYLVGNQSFLDDMRNFTEFLIDVFDLDNNETNQVSSESTSIGEMVVYTFPVIFTAPSGTNNEFTVLTSEEDVYWTLVGNSTTVTLYGLSRGSGTIHFHQYRNNTVYDDRDFVLSNISNGWYYRDTIGFSASSAYLSPYNRYTSSEFYSYLEEYNTVSYYGNNIYILTNTITPPTTSDADGTNSIVITPSGNIYTPQDWDGSVHVDNLPAIVSTGSIPNPGFSEVFLPIRAFVTTFSDGMAIIEDVVFHLPTEALAIFYAIMSITVIFGALHMFKEH